VADPIQAVPLARPDGRIRMLARLSARDAAAWRRAVRGLVPALERVLGPEVLANRTGPGCSGGWRGDLRRARRLAAALRRSAPLLLRTDVRAFYPSVTPSALSRALTAAGVPREPAREAMHMLEAWSAGGHAGLPVGPPPSAVLANAVLAPADRALRAAGLPFLRWVDDYLIALPWGRPEAALEPLDEKLAAWGLLRAPEKTALVDPAEPLRWLGGASRSRNR